jgi:predicted nucleic acid-binding protein
MIRELFVDTTAWYALADADDKYHVSAKEFLPGYGSSSAE